MKCPFCSPWLDHTKVVVQSTHCFFLQGAETILVGSGLIIPKIHRETVFDLSSEEWNDTYLLLQQVKKMLDEQYTPDGYNLGWNCGSVGGQEVFHAHLHLIPRYANEPLAGKGIRYWLKQESNKRP